MKHTIKNIVYLSKYTPELYIKFFQEIFPEATVIDVQDLADANDLSSLTNKIHFRSSVVIFSGGADVTPAVYGEKPHEKTKNNEVRDIVESDLFNYCGSSYKVGICRGAQFLTAMNGGKIIQHVTGHTVDHSIYLKRNSNEITPGSMSYAVSKTSSTHHQMMFPFNLNEKYYDIIAFSQTFRSSKYEGLKYKIPENFVEPEIVHYPKSRSLAIQGHPEFNGYNKYKINCQNIIKSYSNV